MKKLIFMVLFGCTCLHSYGQLPTNNPQASKILLPNGWSLSPVGSSLQLGDLPLNIQISPNKKLLAVTNNGQSTQTLQLIDLSTERIIDERKLGKSWYGLQFSNNGKKLYASGGNDNTLLAFDLSNNKLGTVDTLVLGKAWPKEKISPAGIAADDKKNLLYTVTKEDSSLYILDTRQKNGIQFKLKLGAEAYSCVLSPLKDKLYISLWGGDKLLIFDTQSRKIIASIATESHPNEIILNKTGDFAFVANANSNSVSVINTKSRKIAETISASLYPSNLTGSTSNGLALSPDEKTLYIANADNNCLAVFDVSKPGFSKSKGFIPTGWYPTSVRTVNNKIYVSNGKGFSSLANPNGPQPVKKADDSGYQKGSTDKKDVQYIGGLFKGTLSIIKTPDALTQKKYTKMVYANSPLNKEDERMAKGEANNPIPRKAGEKSPIKYVFYIIKENRTYDQVLGDIPEGNGDPSLCIFGKKITPNQHALVKDFVLLDNFYVDAEVSADGHNWSTAAYATDFVEKTWPTSYGGRGGNYDYEGTRKIAFPKDGFIWDYCKRAGISYRSYGEFADDGKANIKALEGNICPKSPGFDMNISDTVRFNAWKHDFDSLLVLNAVPRFNTIRFSNDHTNGQSRGKRTPIAFVADNDLAVGKFVDHLSHSPIWKESAIFILEDDAQNGSDHIDAHRSTAYVISPYVKRNSVNHTMYSTSGMLRTMELILGLPPMSQYDAAAVPMYACFTNQPDFTPFTFIPAMVDLDARNVALNESSRRSELFNFAKEDSAPDLDLNEVIWKSVKGEHSVMPAPKRSAFVILEQKKKDNDD